MQDLIQLAKYYNIVLNKNGAFNVKNDKFFLSMSTYKIIIFKKKIKTLLNIEGLYSLYIGVGCSICNNYYIVNFAKGHNSMPLKEYLPYLVKVNENWNYKNCH